MKGAYDDPMLCKRLTTIDNPFDPFDDVDRWRAFDEQKGYYTDCLLARICISSDDASPEESEQDWAKAIDDVMKYCDYGIYKVVERDIRV